MIEPIDPRDRFTLQAERDFRGSVRPIYRNISDIDRRPVHIASCLLLDVDGTPIVSTAAHVMDHMRESPLYVWGSKGMALVPILGGRIRSTSVPHFDHALGWPREGLRRRCADEPVDPDPANTGVGSRCMTHRWQSIGPPAVVFFYTHSAANPLSR
jgi:hypothetical protein